MVQNTESFFRMSVRRPIDPVPAVAAPIYIFHVWARQLMSYTTTAKP